MPILLPAAGAQLAGGVSVLIAMTFAAMGRFRFLWFYAAGLLAQTIGLLLWHDSAQAVVMVALISRTLTCVMLVALLVTAARAARVARQRLAVRQDDLTAASLAADTGGSG